VAYVEAPLRSILASSGRSSLSPLSLLSQCNGLFSGCRASKNALSKHGHIDSGGAGQCCGCFLAQCANTTFGVLPILANRTAAEIRMSLVRSMVLSFHRAGKRMKSGAMLT